MSVHDLLGLDEFVDEAEKTTEDYVASVQLTPWQAEDLTMGNWGMQVIGMREGANPLAWEVAVFYIYGQQDFVALGAIEGKSTEELTAHAQELYERNMRFGRLYSPENEVGEVTEVPAFQLIPITEEQAEEVRMCDYKLPIIFGMCPWFREAIEHMQEQFVTSGVDGAEVIVCPKCGDNNSVRGIATYHAQGLFHVLRREQSLELINEVQARMGEVNHMHLVCGREECDYDECVDLNEVEISTDNLR